MSSVPPPPSGPVDDGALVAAQKEIEELKKQLAAKPAGALVCAHGAPRGMGSRRRWPSGLGANAHAAVDGLASYHHVFRAGKFV